MKKIFENVAYFNGNSSEVIDILSNPLHLIKMVSDVKILDSNESGFTIERISRSINRFEKISVQVVDNKVTYISRQGKIEYNLVFNVLDDNSGVKILEDFFLINNISLPIPLIKPILKYSFNINLKNLVKLMGIIK